MQTLGTLSLYLQKKIGNHLVLFYIILHVIIFLGVFTILNYKVYSNPGGLERWFALNILNGHQMPYRDFNVEYPPLAILSFVLPALAFQEPFSYSIAFAAEMLIADTIVLVLLSKLAPQLNIPAWEILGAYTLVILAMGPLTTTRHDMIPAMLVVASIYTFIAGKNKITWALLGLGIMTKIYPVVLAPIFAVYYLRHKQYSELLNGINTMLVVLFLIVTPWLFFNANGFFHFLTYHVDRGLQSESSYASIILIGQIFGLTSARGVFNFGSWNLSSPLADTLAKLSPLVVIGMLFIVYVIYSFIYLKRRKSQDEIESIGNNTMKLTLRFSLLTILILLLTDKVFSPQYLIWVCPFIPLIITRWRYLACLLFIVIAILTQYVYPYHYIEFELAKPLLVSIAATRNFLLIVLVFLVALPELSGSKQAESEVNTANVK